MYVFYFDSNLIWLRVFLCIVYHSQRYRHVDYVQFDNSDIVDRFLNFWRKTGSQRFGFLIGKYTSQENVPLGIPLQVCTVTVQY